MPINGEIKVPTDEQISQAIGFLKEDTRRWLREAKEQELEMFAEGVPLPEIAKVTAIILSLEDTISRFSD
jgi:hypothetical protein